MFGMIILMVMEVVECFEKVGVLVKVVNVCFIKLMDEVYLYDFLGKNILILMIEEVCLIGGFGIGVVEFVFENGYYSVLVEWMGILDCFIEYGSVIKLLEEIGLMIDVVVDCIYIMILLK